MEQSKSLQQVNRQASRSGPDCDRDPGGVSQKLRIDLGEARDRTSREDRVTISWDLEIVIDIAKIHEVIPRPSIGSQQPLPP
eukprot:7623447-Pyramimonas_sp.AAC.1